MAVTTTIDSNSVVIKLNNGVSSEGKILTVNVNLTGIKSTAISDEDKQKILNIVTALSGVFDKAVTSTIITTRSSIEESA